MYFAAYIHVIILVCSITRKIFPHVSPEAVEVPIQGSTLDRIRQKHAEQELAAQT
jgi:hypothetical protein